MAGFKKRHREVLEKLLELHQATGRQIAEKMKLDVNGIMQTLNALSGGVFMVQGKKYKVCSHAKNTKEKDPDRIIWYLKEKIQTEG